VLRILRRYGVAYPRKRTFEKYLETDVDKERVYNLYKELNLKYKSSWVVTEISERFKVSKAEVRRCLKTMGSM